MTMTIMTAAVTTVRGIPLARRSAGPAAASIRRRWRSSTGGGGGGKKKPDGGGGGDKSRTATTTTSFGIGALAGICGSLAGMGGGFLMVPMMTSSSPLLFGCRKLTQHQAHATSLFAVATTGLAGSLSYAGSGAVDLPVAASIAACGMATASLGARVSLGLSQDTLRKVLGVFMLAIAPTIPLREIWKEEEEKKKNPSPVGPEGGIDEVNDDGTTPTAPMMRRYLAAGGIGCCAGFLSGMFGVGGGAVVVPALALGMDMDHRAALGTSLCAMVPTAVAGTLTHLRRGTVATRIAPGLALGAFAGGLIGGNLGLSIPERDLKRGFGATMAVLGLRSILR